MILQTSTIIKLTRTTYSACIYIGSWEAGNGVVIPMKVLLNKGSC